MYAGLIRSTSHNAIQRINLFGEMPFTDSTDGRVTTHLPKRFQVLRKQQRIRTHPSGCSGSLGTGMATTDYDNVICLLATHVELIPDRSWLGLPTGRTI